MSFLGTFSNNKRPVITTAPDCLVYINGELSLPSGATPGKRINIQPLITSVSVQAGIEQSPGSANFSLSIPRHYIGDFFRGGRIILDRMMEVRIFMKGHFTVGGAPRYYPVFWGLIISISESRSGGHQTVEVSCQDILYWWTIQRINVNPSLTGQGVANQSELNIKGGGIFTNINPFDVMYSLSRYAYGDATNANIFLEGNQIRTEPNPAQNESLMKYWTKQWGRIAFSLKMFGPRGDVIQGDLLAKVLSEQNKQAAFAGKEASAIKNRSKNYKAFDHSDVNFAEISAFTEVASRMGAIEIWSSEFQSKKEIADITKQAIGYEFFLDMTGEMIFKPPFYNLDVIDNKPVSWIRPIDVINQNFSYNVPEVTSLEATGAFMLGLELSADELVKPKATYTDYRLVQKYGWRPGNFSSAFFGAGLKGESPQNLFYHLVDELDRQNVRMEAGSVTIPIRPELRLGYPIYHEQKDAYFYVDNISHQFSYSGQCTSTLTLIAKRERFYAAFPYWKNISKEGDSNQENQPPRGQIADPSVAPNNIYARPKDPVTGNPVGDKNVILVSVPDTTQEDTPETFKEEMGTETKAMEVARDLVSLRNQFRVFGDKDYVYMIDPARDEQPLYEGRKKRSGPLTSLAVQGSERIMPDGSKKILPYAEFPVSDERGYEVIGSFEYGRNVRLTRSGMDFTMQGDRRSRSLLMLAPDGVDSSNTNPSLDGDNLNPLSSNQSLDSDDEITMLDPNNYGRRLSELKPEGSDYFDYISESRSIFGGKSFGNDSTPISKNPNRSNNPDRYPSSDISFKRSELVERWKKNGALQEARRRAASGNPPVTNMEAYSDDLLLAFIQIESRGISNAHRPGSQFRGIVQIGKGNAKDLGRSNMDFAGESSDDFENAVESLAHLMRYMNKYKEHHEYDLDRMIITWKGGPGTAKTVGKMEKRGASDAEIGQYLTKWRTNLYVARIHDSMKIWEDIEEPLDYTPDLDYTPVDGPPQPNDDGQLPPSPDDLEKELEEATQDFLSDTNPYEDEIELSNLEFAKNLQANRFATALPSNFQPIRDTGLLPYINQFLKEIYYQAFENSYKEEKRLRGETRGNDSPLNVRHPPPSVVENSLIDSPLSRPDVQEDIDELGLSKVLGTEGTWTETEEKIKADLSGKDYNFNPYAFNDEFSGSSSDPFSNNDPED